MVIEHSETHIVVNYCRYILQKSRNVMLTSVIVSAAEAYPDKLFEIVCDLLRTKELFHLDSYRFTAESSASFLLSGKDLLEKERLESNRLSFRKSGWKRLFYRIKPTPAVYQKKPSTCGSKRCIRRLTGRLPISIPGHPITNLPITGWI